MAPRDNAPAPLAGINVLDLTRFPPGGYCTLMLADLGAEVCRVDHPQAHSIPGAVGLRRAKRSVAIDLRHPDSREVLKRLVRWADVVVENERPGAMEGRGFGFSHASSEDPALIWCSISGYGQTGPYAQWSGHDISFLAHSGLLAAMNPELPWHPQSILAIPAGALMAVIGILGALRSRDRNGVGGHIDISMSESATWMLAGTDTEINGEHGRIPTGPDRHLYPCADGAWVAVAAAESRTWDALCLGLGLPDLVGTLHRWADPEDVVQQIASAFQTRPAREWVAALGPAAAVVQANRGPEVRSDPQIAARGTLIEIDGVTVPSNPVRIRHSDGASVPAPPTALSDPGADTREILSRAGLRPDELLDLQARGVIGGGS